MRSSSLITLVALMVVFLGGACVGDPGEPDQQYYYPTTPNPRGSDARTPGDGDQRPADGAPPSADSDRVVGDRDGADGDNCSPSSVAAPACWSTCGTAADCAVESIADGAYGVDNYACDDLVCRYTGCRSDDECNRSLASSGRAARCVPAFCAGEAAYCQYACDTAADCASETIPNGAYGADNFDCADGVCTYRGCSHDSECETTFAATGKLYRCSGSAGSVSWCQQACAVSADCAATATGAFDADNYACTSGTCQWLGCHSTAECQTSYASTEVVCSL